MSPINKAVPIMARFLVEDRDRACRLDRTIPLNIPYITIIAPPKTGYGMVTKIADILPITPNIM